VQRLDQLPFDPLVANNAARLLYLSPGAVTNYESLVALAERALTEARDEQQRMIHQNTLGVIQYGAGRYQEAIDRWNQRVKADAAAGAPVDWVFLAMAHHRLGHRPEADRWREKLRASNDLWWNDLEIVLLTREMGVLLRVEMKNRK
jgi:hypothetical protein